MTPAARLSAAIEILDQILAGAHAEAALLRWSRASRYAGSGDRLGVRDLVYDALRRRSSFAALGGGLTGRGLILGGLRAAGTDADVLFDGVGHAPAKLTETDMGRAPVGAEALDLPDWLVAPLQASLGKDFNAVCTLLQQRAPVFLRVNLTKSSQAHAIAALRGDGIDAVAAAGSNTALEVVGNARKIQTSTAYLSGAVELQDLSSQQVVEALPVVRNGKVLDYCAGGGGKVLAMAGLGMGRLFAHDAAPSRMRDIPARAKRAGAKVSIVENPDMSAPYDLILCDAPCSGSGSWRRDPAGKWSLTADKLSDILTLQAKILDQAQALVAPNGTLAYATCSMLRAEDEDQAQGFLARNPDWRMLSQHRFSPLQGGDGFFLALFARRPL